ncbi:MAG: hypothetical protein K2Y21_12145 [Phycisphaerales bacterium]|nr:hypothetical protein [Phycisphaerales bacterium]
MPEFEGYNNTATDTQLGSRTITLPQGFSHTSTVTPAGASDRFRASYYYQPAGVSGHGDGYSATLVTNFTVTGARHSAQISINGGTSGGFFGKSTTNPDTLNAHVVIFDSANAVIFDSFDSAVVMNDGSAGRGSMAWNNVVRTVALGPGSYRLAIGAINDSISFYGGGSARTAYTTIDVTVAFLIPGPGAVALVPAVLMLAARRRRR